jgi:hypothetical protein
MDASRGERSLQVASGLHLPADVVDSGSVDSIDLHQIVGRTDAAGLTELDDLARRHRAYSPQRVELLLVCCVQVDPTGAALASRAAQVRRRIRQIIFSAPSYQLAESALLADVPRSGVSLSAR